MTQIAFLLFLWTKTEKLLVHCFSNNMIIPRQVYDEISKVPHLRLQIDNMLNAGNLLVEDISIGSEENNLCFGLNRLVSQIKHYL